MRHNATHRLLKVSLVFVFSVVLRYIYVEDILPLFEYYGYDVYSKATWLEVVLSIAAALPAAFLPDGQRRPSDFVIWVIYIAVLVPSLTLGSYRVGLTASQDIVLGAVLILSLFALVRFSERRVIRFQTVKSDLLLFWIAIGLVQIISAATVISIFGTDLSLASVFDVYDTRYEYKDVLSGVPRVVKYLVTWSGGVFGPFLIAFGLRRRAPFVVAVGVLNQVLMFAVGGHKSVLFSTLVILTLYFMLTRTQVRIGTAVVASSLALIVGLYALDLWVGQNAFTLLVTRRVFTTPGSLMGIYVDFFSEHPKVFLSNSVLSPLFDYPYDAPIGSIIGLEYFDSDRMSANANFLANAYANFGYAGMLVFSVLAGLVLSVINTLAERKDGVVVILMVAVPAIALSNSALFTVILTHGLAMSMFIAYVMPQGTRGGSR